VNNGLRDIQDIDVKTGQDFCNRRGNARFIDAGDADEDRFFQNGLKVQASKFPIFVHLAMTMWMKGGADF
jgi:hypothetical protein